MLKVSRSAPTLKDNDRDKTKSKRQRVKFHCVPARGGARASRRCCGATSARSKRRRRKHWAGRRFPRHRVTISRSSPAIGSHLTVVVLSAKFSRACSVSLVAWPTVGHVANFGGAYSSRYDLLEARPKKPTCMADQAMKILAPEQSCPAYCSIGSS